MHILEVTSVHHWDDPRIHSKFCRTLVGAGHRVTLCAPGAPAEPSPGLTGVPLTTERGVWARLWIRPREITRAVSGAPKGTLVHAHDPELLPWLVFWRWRYGIKALFDAHEDFVASFEYKPYLTPWQRRLGAVLAGCLMRWGLRRVDGWIAATGPIGELAGAAAPRTPGAVVRNVPRLAPYLDAGRKPLIDRPPVAVYVGSLTRARGLHTMLEAFRHGIPGVPDARLLLAGPCPSPGDRQALMNTTAAPDRHVDYLGVIGSDAIPALLEGAQVGLCVAENNVNYRAGIPTKVLEYQAAGLAIVATNMQNYVPLVAKTGTGILIEDGDPTALQDALCYLWTTPSEMERYGAAGRGAVSNMSWEKEEAALVAHCELVGSPHPSDIVGARPEYSRG